MKSFNNKVLVKLIASICLFLTLFNVAGTTKVYAKDDTYVLVRPVVHLLTAVGDAIVNVMHRVAVDQTDTLFKIRGYTTGESILRVLGVVVVTILAVVVAAVVCYFTAGTVAFIAAKIAGTAFTVTAAMVGSAALGRNNSWCCSWFCCIFRIFS